jgi:hypothetical protein
MKRRISIDRVYDHMSILTTNPKLTRPDRSKRPGPCDNGGIMSRKSGRAVFRHPAFGQGFGFHVLLHTFAHERSPLRSLELV